MRINYTGLAMLLSLISAFGTGAAAPNVRWAQTLEGTRAYRLAADAGGFCYLVGSFTGTNGLYGTNVLVSRGADDVLLAKFSPEGSNIWARTAGGSNTEEGRAVTADDSGNVYITGLMTSDSTFGATNLLHQGSRDAFLAKYDSNGNVVWVRQAWSPTSFGVAQGTALTVNGTNLLWAGSCGGSIDFGGGVSITNVSVFVCRYNLEGDLISAHNAGYGSSDRNIYAYDVVLGGTGDYYIAHNFNSPTFHIGTTTITMAGTYSDSLVTKWDANGNLLWFKQVSGFFGECHAGAPNPDGSVDVLGRTFKPGTFGGVPVPDAFLSRITETGSVLWVKNLSTNMEVFNLARDTAGNIFIGAALTRGGTDFCGVPLTNASSFTLPLVAKLDSLGDVLWIKTGTPAGTNGNYNAAWGLAVTASGAVYFGGPAYSDFDLDSRPIRTNGLSGAFLTRLDPEPPGLHIMQSGSSTILSWSTNQTGFVLERSPSMFGTWDVAADAIWRLGDSFVFTNASQHEAEYFRLRLQE